MTVILAIDTSDVFYFRGVVVDDGTAVSVVLSAFVGVVVDVVVVFVAVAVVIVVFVAVVVVSFLHHLSTLSCQ